MFRLAAATRYALAVIILAVPPAAAHADQPAPIPNKPAPSPGKSRMLPGQAPNTSPVIEVTIDFRGGKFGEFVNAVRAAAEPVPINVLLPSEVEQLDAPALMLKQVNAMTAFSVMAEQINDQLGPASSIGVRQVSSAPGEALTLRFQQFTHVERPNVPHRATEIYAIRDVIEPPSELQSQPGTFFSLDDVMGAINAAVQLGAVPHEPSPDLVLHKESMTLACRATTDQQRTIEHVLTRLRETIEPRRKELLARADRTREASLRRLAIDAELEQAALQYRHAEQELEAAESRRLRLEKLSESGEVSVYERDQARQASSAAATNFQQARSNVTSLESRRDILAATGDAGDALLPVFKICYNFAPIGEPDAAMSAIIEYLAVAMPPRLGAGKVERVGSWLVVHTTQPRHDNLKGVINAAIAAQTGRADFDVERSTDPIVPEANPAPR